MSSLTLKNPPNNVIVRQGTFPPAPTVDSMTSYQYELISFKDIRIQMETKSEGEGGATVSNVSFDVLKEVMQSEPAVVYVQDMQSASPTSQEIVGSTMWDIIKDYPSAFINKNGAFMQQILIPFSGDDIDNGILGEENQQASGNNSGETQGEPLNWSCNMSSPECGFRASTKEGCGYINLSNTRSDESQITDKVYEVSPSKQGAFAMMFHFTGSPTIKKDSEKPKVIIDINKENGLIVTSQTSDAILTVKGQNKAVGSLTASDNGYNVPHIEGNSEIKPTTIFVYPIFNGLAVTSNLSNSLKDENTIMARCSKKTYNAFDELSPSLKDYPSKFVEDATKPTIQVDPSKQTIFDFGSIKVSWINCWGSFCYSPIVFSNTSVISYYFKGEYQPDNTDSTVTYTYYAVPIFYDNGGNAKMNPTTILTAKKAYDDTTLRQSYYKIEFEIGGGNTSNKPGQLFGFIKILERKGPVNSVTKGDGTKDFSITPTGSILTDLNPTFFTQDTSWVNYILSVNTRCGLDGIGGSITLDKYALYSDIGQIPQQKISKLRLDVEDGPYGTSVINLNGYGIDKHFFTGYTLDISDNVSDSSPTININLCGVDRKLQDIKLVNCPFWDGDLMFGDTEKYIMHYFKNYTGCHFVWDTNHFSTNPETIRVPASFNYQKPAVDFTLGTSCLQALRQLANMCNLQFVIQPNGKGYFYEMNDRGVPYYVVNGTVINDYANTDIISMNVSPYLQNKFNTFLTMGYLVKKTPTGISNPLQVSVKPGMLLSNNDVYGVNFPWSRIKTTAAPGYLTISELQKFHESNMKFGTADIYQGTVTVPGISGYAIFDKISINETVYYITAIQQNIDLQSKVWTTNLSIAKYEENTTT